MSMFATQNVSAESVNLAEGKTVVASSTYSNEYAASKLTDGNVYEGWIANPSESSSWVYVDLGSQQTVSSVSIYWGTYDYASAFKVQVSNDASQWEDRYSTTAGTGGKSDISFEPTQARYVRVLCTAKSTVGNWSYEIYELNVYGSDILPTPANLRENGKGNTSVVLSWDSSVNATGYKLYRGDTEIYSGAATSYTDTGLSENTTYAYKVMAYNASQQSDFSDAIFVTIPGNVTIRHNAAYLNSEWFNADYPLTDAKIASYVNELKSYSIGYQFCDIGKWEILDGAAQPEVHLSASDYADLGHWIKVSRETDPKQKIIATINTDIRAAYYVDMNGNELPFGKAVREEAVSLCNTLVNTGVLYNGVYYKVDGIQVDFEPFESQCHTYYKNVLTGIRNVIGSSHLSTATPILNQSWDNDYAKSIINIVDMVNPMMYDTNGPESWGDYSNGVTQNSEEYIRLMKDTTAKYSEWIAGSNNTDCQLCPIVPAYSDSICHKYSIENVGNCITGIRQAINAGATAYGAGVFWWDSMMGRDPKYTHYEQDKIDWLNWVIN
ncbi:MAG TPA: discoidin domain-containing protein [Lachnospiraceae bacterium]|nr:discoidin domain-containing protein [Lachnospiraceae bacterium]